jgi:hypothetical protein
VTEGNNPNGKRKNALVFEIFLPTLAETPVPERLKKTGKLRPVDTPTCRSFA